MLERLVIWSIFGLILSMTPLAVVVFMTWQPSAGVAGFLRLTCNEDLLAVALTLGGAAAADVLIHSSGRLRVIKIIGGGLTFLATVDCMGIFVVTKAHLSHFDSNDLATTVGFAALTTLAGAMICEVLAEA